MTETVSIIAAARVIKGLWSNDCTAKTPSKWTEARESFSPRPDLRGNCFETKK